MATKTPSARSLNSGLFEIACFAVVAGLFMFVSAVAGTRAAGVAMLAGAVLQQVRGRIPYGWEGREPSGFLTGGTAKVVNLIMAAIGVALAIWPRAAMNIFGWSNE